MNCRNSSSSSGSRDREQTAQTQRGEMCSQLMDKLQMLQEAGHMCDLTFELRGQQFYAHRVVVSAWSPLVYSLCSHDSIESQTIRVHYDNTEVFASFLAFLYAGRMNSVAEENLIQVLHLATSLQVNGLRQTCEEALKQQLHIGNIISTFHVARKFKLPNLEEYALNFMQMNLPEAVKQADFLSLTPSRFNSFLSSGWVCVMKPEIKLFLIISWLGYDVKERQQYLVLLLRYIDWSVVADDFLLEISQTENFFTTNESSLYLLLQTLFSSTIPLGPYTDLFPALREKYGYLLEHIVQNSYVLPLEPEEYFPVTFQVVNEPSHSNMQTAEGSGAMSANHRTQAEASIEFGLNEGAYLVDLQDISDDDADVDPVVSALDRAEVLSRNKTSNQKQRSLTTKAKKVKMEVEPFNPVVPSTDMSGGHSRAKWSKKKNPMSSSQAKMTSKDEVNVTPKTRTPPRKEATAARESTPTTREKEKMNQTSSQSESQRAHSTQSVSNETGASTEPQSPEAYVSNRTRRKRGTPRKLNSTSSPVSSHAKQPPAPSPSKVRDTSTTTTKGPLRLKYRECQKAALEQNSLKIQDSSIGDNNSPVNSASNVSRRQNLIEVSSESSHSVDATPHRSKRKAAAKFSVPEKLLPRRKTRASAKAQKAASKTETLRVSEAKASETLKASDLPAGEHGPKHQMQLNWSRSGFTENDSSMVHEQTPEKRTAEETRKTQSSLHAPGNLTSATVGVKMVLSDGREEETVSTPPKQGRKPKHACNECDHVAHSAKRLMKHKSAIHSRGTTVFTCHICQYQCRWNRHYYDHMRGHFSGPPFTCDTEGCGYSSDRIQAMLTHRRKHTDERPYKCRQCDARFRTRNNLYAHQKCHSDEKKYECPECHRHFRMKNTLDQHLVTHSSDRPYLCDTCGFSTKFQSHLIAHKRIHTGDVYHCSFPMCVYSTPKRSQLKAHMRSHLNLRNHQCHVCHKAFMEKSHLVRHLRIHQMDRPHACDKCEYVSTRPDKLREHINKHHGENATSKRKWKPRGKAVKTSATADKVSKPTTNSTRKRKNATVVTAQPQRDSSWVEASLATLVSAAEEIRLAEGSLENSERESVIIPAQNEVKEFVRVQLQTAAQGPESTPSVPAGREDALTVPYQTITEPLTPDPVTHDLGQGQVSGGKTSRGQITGEHSSQGQFSQGQFGGGQIRGGQIMTINKNRSTSVPTSSHLNQPIILQHHRQQQTQQQVHTNLNSQQRTSSTLLQQLALTVCSTSSAIPPRNIHHSSTIQAGMSTAASPTLLPHTSSPDGPSASRILYNALQQHATATAADGLASLSSGLGSAGLHGQGLGDGADFGAYQGLQNSGLANVAAAPLHQQQPHGQVPEGQHQSYSGLNAFMTLF